MITKLSHRDFTLLARLLTLASNDFATKGCNDFDLVHDGGLSPKGIAELRQKMTTHEFTDEDETQDILEDWVLMGYYAQRCLDAADALVLGQDADTILEECSGD